MKLEELKELLQVLREIKEIKDEIQNMLGESEEEEREIINPVEGEGASG